MAKEDNDFMVGSIDENPVTHHVFESAKKVIAMFEEGDQSIDAHLASTLAYSIAGMSELERRLIVLEATTRELLGR